MHGFVHLCDGTTVTCVQPAITTLCGGPNNAQLVHCVLTVEKIWLTTFLSTIKTAVIFYFRVGVLNFKLLLSDVYLSHINHKQRRWHNNHLSIVQYSQAHHITNYSWTLWHKFKGWIRPSNQTIKKIRFTMRPQRVLYYKSHRCSVKWFWGMLNVQHKDLRLQQLTCALLRLCQCFVTCHRLLLNVFCYVADYFQTFGLQGCFGADGLCQQKNTSLNCPWKNIV